MKKKLIMVCLLFIALISGCAKKDAAANLEDKPTIKLAVCSGAGSESYQSLLCRLVP